MLVQVWAQRACCICVTQAACLCWHAVCDQLILTTAWSQCANRCVRALEAGSDRRRIKTVVLPDGEQFKTLEQVEHARICINPHPSYRCCSSLSLLM